MQIVVGNYRIVELLGTGGMGAVYRAEHVSLGSPAAIKVLLPEHAADRAVVGRLFDEARAATSVSHPGIVEVFDFGRLDDGSAYMAMELLQGQSLAARLAARGRLSEDEAFAIVRGIASALGAAHAKGIVHRDLKPDNVFLVPDPDAPTGERVKLLDFGIAKLTADRGGPRRTRTGTVLGTPMYMAPEQCRGAAAVDHRADLYAVGCILFELLTGRPPFEGEGTGEVLGAHLHLMPPRLSARIADASARAELVVARLLEKRPDDRVASTAALVRLLGSRSRPPVCRPDDLTLRVSPAPPSPRKTTLALATSVRVPAPTRSLRAQPRSRAHLLIAAAALLSLAIAIGVIARHRPTRWAGKPFGTHVLRVLELHDEASRRRAIDALPAIPLPAPPPAAPPEPPPPDSSSESSPPSPPQPPATAPRTLRKTDRAPRHGHETARPAAPRPSPTGNATPGLPMTKGI